MLHHQHSLHSRGSDDAVMTEKRQSIQRNVVCFKCRYLQYLTKDSNNQANCQFLGGELGHYANDPHCFKCKFLETSVRFGPLLTAAGDKYGHLANEPHCYKCRFLEVSM